MKKLSEIKRSRIFKNPDTAQRSFATLKKLCSNKHHKVIEVPWGATPPRPPLLLSNMARCGSSARLPGFLLDIGPPLGLYP